MGQLNPVAVREFLEVVRQLLGARHFCTVDQHGNYGNISPQRRSSFEANEVGRIVEAPLPRLILGVGPLFADDRQQDTAGGNAIVDCFAKVSSYLDRRYIHEHRVLAEDANEIVEQTPRFAF